MVPPDILDKRVHLLLFFFIKTSESTCCSISNDWVCFAPEVDLAAVAPKINKILWRFDHNSLPLRANIRVRHRCPTQQTDEDGCHMFLNCKYTSPPSMPIWKDTDYTRDRQDADTACHFLAETPMTASITLLKSKPIRG